MPGDDRRHGLDRDLDPLPRREQAERGEHTPPDHALDRGARRPVHGRAGAPRSQPQRREVVRRRAAGQEPDRAAVRHDPHALRVAGPGLDDDPARVGVKTVMSVARAQSSRSTRAWPGTASTARCGG